MLNREMLKKIAIKHVDSLEDYECALCGEPVEKEYGSIFYYQSKAFIDTGNEKKVLIGCAPFLVLKENGKIIVLGTAHPEEEYAEAFINGVWEPTTIIDDYVVEDI